MPRLRARGAAAGGLLAVLLAAPAPAEQRIDAAPPNRYATAEVAAAQGERVIFRNSDVAAHDVTADAVGPDGKPLFSTPIIQRGEEAVVQGTEYLPSGTYAFHCSVHPQMKGTLRITTAGAPVPRPAAGQPAAPDRRAPRLGVRVLGRSSRVVRRDGLAVRVSVDEGARVRLLARARPHPGGPVVTVARGSVSLPAGGVRRVALSLTAAGRHALRRPRALGILLGARAVDPAGNAARRVAGRNLRP